MRKLVLAFIFAVSASAQNPQDYDRYLIPVIQRDLRGANGSVWTADLLFRNRWSREMTLVGPQLVICTCTPPPVPANTTTSIALFARGDGADGAFLYVPKSLNDPRPAITLHVRDTSTNATSFGSEIHLPLPDEFQQQVDLIGIPTDARYRGTLRIYGTTAAPQEVRVRTYDDINGALLSEERVTLSGILNIAADPFPAHPAYAQRDAIPDSVHAADAQRIRVTVDVMGENVSPPPLPIWAFITVTDNVTQLTSTITPSR
jgi:hypothetical protein